MKEIFQISIPRRMAHVRTTLVISLVVSLVLSYKLWFSDRLFPYAPVLSFGEWTERIEGLYFTLIIFFWIASLLLKWQRFFILLSLLVAVWFVLLDINRLQPWFYYYNALLAVFVFYNGRVDDPNKYTSFFIILQLIMASLYFYSGISQLNASFVFNEFTDLISPIRAMVSERQFHLIVKSGYAVPYVLMFIGIGLIVAPVRYLAISLAILLHLTLFILMFPSQKHPNYALWFSNFTFITVLFFLFTGKTKQRYFSPTFLLQRPFFYIVIILFVVMPAFNQRNIWPDFLSANFRSGSTQKVQITTSAAVVSKIPVHQVQYFNLADGKYILNYEKWCLTELGADCVPHELVFNSIYSYLQKFGENDVKETELKMLQRAGILRKP